MRLIACVLEFDLSFRCHYETLWDFIYYETLKLNFPRLLLLLQNGYATYLYVLYIVF